MSDNKSDGRFTFLRPVRAVYANILEARKFKENGVEKGDAKFDVTVAVKPEDLKEFGETIKKVANAKWPGRSMAELKFPYKKSEDMIAAAGRKAERAGKNPAEIAAAIDKAKARFPAGHYIIKAASKFPVTVSRFVKGVPTAFGAADVAEAKKRVYAGCWLVPIINLVPYLAKKEEEKDGLTAYLDQVLVVDTPKGENGDRMGSTAADPRDAFKAYAGTISGEDPTGAAPADLDDEIPF